MMRFTPSEIEPKWQKIWANDQRYKAPDESDKPKYYVTGMFPYPSGAGMHTGHFFEHSIVDAVARFKRATGHNVMYPMGWDAFGLPAENYAIKTGTAPAVSTEQNIANFTNQLQRVGASIDWSREITTSHPDYYRWTQWVFTKFYERGLAYQKEANQWWCPVDKTVLANEQVENGKCWRCGSEVEKKSMKQWFFKITDYADALLDETPALNWPDKIKTAQTNWIGKSQGAEIDFKLAFSPPKSSETASRPTSTEYASVSDGAADVPDDLVTSGSADSIRVFTTRPDTIFGATFMVIAPEHPLVSTLATDETREMVERYVKTALKKSEIERQSEGKEKTGVFTGSYAINPANDEKIPIWIADYVLGGYGTGAIMAVPAHDERDFDFATKYQLPVEQAVAEYEEIRDGSYRSIKDDAENLDREVIDAIVRNQKDQYLVLRTDLEGFFVGGGVEPDDKNLEDTIRREVAEETGYTNIISINRVTPSVAAKAYKPKKQRNEKTWGAFYEVIVDDTVQVRNESDDGKHELVWVSKSEVKKVVTVKHHLAGWTTYLNGGKHDYCKEGILVNSGAFDGMSTSEAREEVVAWLSQQGMGRAKTTYKMRDWLISRQRYWGAPIPIIHCETDGAVPVPEDQLPVMLPDVKDFEPKGDSVLATQTDWVNTTCPKCGGPAKRETDTMDGYACSSWYLLRYTDPKNENAAWDPEKAKYWTPIDMYVGGDHAVAHLLYVRFWNHVFYDMGMVPSKEPVGQLVYHGLIQAEDGRKMSKSLGNVVDPLEVIDAGYGADALRTFELFLGPINENSNWSSKGIAGVHRFLNRVWTLTQEYIEAEKADGKNADLIVLQHKTIKKVTTDIHRLSFNTAIAALMEYVNDLYKLKTNGYSNEWQQPIEALIQLVQPFAPHMAAELWQQLGHEDQLDFVHWPEWDEALTVADTITIVVQVNGKVRAKLEVSADVSEDDVKAAALAEENVQKFIGDKKPAKVIYVPGRLVSIVL